MQRQGSEALISLTLSVKELEELKWELLEVCQTMNDDGRDGAFEASRLGRVYREVDRALRTVAERRKG